MNLSKLNEFQHQAVTSDGKNILVIAGAGSGKTGVLTNRIAYLYTHKNISPINILAVTFTNKAAQEMKKRLENILGFSTYGMWIGTFHGLAHRFLRRHAIEIGFEKNFKILDQNDQIQIIKKVLKSLNLDEKIHPPKYIQQIINDKKDNGLRSVDINKSSIDAQTLKIYKAYELRMKSENAMDFADLLLCTYELFRDNKIIRNHYQQYFKHIVVDEFQDTNKVQYLLLKYLKTKDNFIMAVGDDDQSIYAWRGAKIENIEHYISDFSPVEIIRLEQNYRSTQTILNAANDLISNNEKRMGKNLWSNNDNGDLIDLYEAEDERDEACFIVKKVLEIKNKNISYKDMAIFYRSNAQSRVLEEALLKFSVPYRIYGGLRFFERSEIKDALAYVRLIASKNDNLAFERVINTPVRGIGIKTIDFIRNYSNEHNISLWSGSLEVTTKKLLSSRACKSVEFFLDLINKMSENQKNLSLGKTVQYVIEASGLLDSYINNQSEKSQQKAENLKELVNSAIDFTPQIQVDDDFDLLVDFLSFAVLESGEMQADENTDYVQMMTLHSAKGLEYPYVFISGLEEGLFPTSRSIDNEEKMAEERRLCYVGITRAMNKLHLSFSNLRYQYGDQLYLKPSRFLKEIPTKYIFDLFKNNDKQKIKAKPFGISPFDFIKKTKNSAFKKGDVVNHHKFGIGIFLKEEGDGSQTHYHIEFRSGKKVLLAEMCKITKV